MKKLDLAPRGKSAVRSWRRFARRTCGRTERNGTMNKCPFEYVSDPYVSNCIIEALYQKFRHPIRTKIYFCKPNERQMFHFMWSDGTADYDFSDEYCEREKYFVKPLFTGRIRRFRLGFAALYSASRNIRRR
ncbi:MAG: hypothetical protein J6X53_06955 [Abditibacteriota bacterium]|nr:hypothetical protein [Abditibacteriota bacterium]